MWRVNVAANARKAVDGFPPKDRDRILAALEEMAADPFSGDIRKLGANEYRRRIGSYRVRYTVYAQLTFVQVTAIVRRTSTTYGKRSQR
jgi:mRNA-degrading endonuclease RelE of RelBE toxin-antitoxin system